MPIFTQFSPNMQSAEVLSSLGRIFGNWFSLKKGKALGNLKQEIENEFQAQVTFFDSGRTALYAILESLPGNKKNEVIVQAYTCVVVVNAIKKAGYEPVYVDTEPGTFKMNIDDLKKKLNQKTKAVVLQHTYGNADHMPEILKVAKDIFVIEDLAHALTSSYKGQLLGTFGHAAFLSFGSGKVISSSRGGAALTKDSKLHQEIQELESNLEHLSSLTILRHHLKHVLFAICKPIYFPLGKICLYLGRKLKLIPAVITKSEKSGQAEQAHKFANSLAKLALIQWRKKDSVKEHRHKIARIYDQHLSKIDQIKTYDHNQESSMMTYPIQAQNADQLFQFLKKHHIILDNYWAKAIVVPKSVDQSSTGYSPNSCLNAEKQTQNELNLPTHIHISSQKANRLCDLIKKFYERTPS